MLQLISILIDKPGWNKGTKITFPEKVNETYKIIPSNLVFIIEERAHPKFKRDGNDLNTHIKSPSWML